MTLPAPHAETRVLFPPDICRRYGIDRTTCWRWRQTGKLPRPDVEVHGRPGWYEATIVDFERPNAIA